MIVVHSNLFYFINLILVESTYLTLVISVITNTYSVE